MRPAPLAPDPGSARRDGRPGGRARPCRPRGRGGPIVAVTSVAQLPRTRLAVLPTPLVEAPRLADGARAGRAAARQARRPHRVRAWRATRPASSRCSLGEAMEQDADVLVTGGSVGSNFVPPRPRLRRTPGWTAMRPGDRRSAPVPRGSPQPGRRAHLGRRGPIAPATRPRLGRRAAPRGRRELPVTAARPYLGPAWRRQRDRRRSATGWQSTRSSNRSTGRFPDASGRRRGPASGGTLAGLVAGSRRARTPASGSSARREPAGRTR